MRATWSLKFRINCRNRKMGDCEACECVFKYCYSRKWGYAIKGINSTLWTRIQAFQTVSLSYCCRVHMDNFTSNFSLSWILPLSSLFSLANSLCFLFSSREYNSARYSRTERYICTEKWLPISAFITLIYGLWPGQINDRWTNGLVRDLVS